MRAGRVPLIKMAAADKQMSATIISMPPPSQIHRDPTPRAPRAGLHCCLRQGRAPGPCRQQNPLESWDVPPEGQQGCSLPLISCASLSFHGAAEGMQLMKGSMSCLRAALRPLWHGASLPMDLRSQPSCNSQPCSHLPPALLLPPCCVLQPPLWLISPHILFSLILADATSQGPACPLAPGDIVRSYGL